MAVELLALLLQAPAATYRTGPSTPAPYSAGPAAAPAHVWPPAQTSSGQGTYAISPDAILLRPRLRPTGVMIDAYDPSVEAFRNPDDRAYEATVLGGAAAAQGRQGSLDGAWDLAVEGGASLYAFQLAQEADGDPVEGSWLNVAATPGAKLSGFVMVAQEPARVVLRFFDPSGTEPITVTLSPATGGAWRGQLARGEAVSNVVMRRR